MEKRVDNKGRILRVGEYQRSDGMYEFRYFAEDGVRKYLYSWKLVSQDSVPPKKKCSKSLREMEDDLNFISGFTERTTVLQGVQEVLTMRTDYARSTMDTYQIAVRQYIAPSKLGQLRLTQVSKDDVREFYQWLVDENGLGYSSIKAKHALLNAVFQIAVRDGLITQNPCSGCMKVVKKDSSVTTSLMVQEQHELLEFLKDGSQYFSMYYDIVAVLLGTGLRISELIGLTWDEVDFDNKCIRLSHQDFYDEVNGRKEHSITPLKTGVSRIIPLPKVVLTILECRWRESAGNFVFTNRDGMLYNRRGVNSILSGIVKEFNQQNRGLKLPKLSSHVLRHTYCTRLVELGVDLRIVQEIMGHKTAKVTLNVYTHVSQKNMFDEMNRIPEIDLGE